MVKSQYQQDWATDSYNHNSPFIPGGTNADVVKILTWLKEYDEKCLEARAQMIKKINELLGNTKPER